MEKAVEMSINLFAQLLSNHIWNEYTELRREERDKIPKDIDRSPIKLVYNGAKHCNAKLVRSK